MNAIITKVATGLARQGAAIPKAQDSQPRLEYLALYVALTQVAPVVLALLVGVCLCGVIMTLI